MSKQIRYGKGNGDKVRVASITQQQISELADALDLTQAGVMQEAIVRLYTQTFIAPMAKKLAELQKEYESLYVAYCDAINK
jgi:DNA-binding GntR family transcriptional regulator